MTAPIEEGRCLGCDGAGPVGDPCPESVCDKFLLHYIPERYYARLEAPSPGDRDPVVGTRIGDHLVVGVVGRGGFAHVYLVLQLPELMECALKLMHTSYQSHEHADDLIRKFRGEATTLAALNHPNIVRLIRSGTLGGRPYIIMEYAEAIRLKDEINRRRSLGKPFQRHEVLGIFDQICFGLQAAHDKNIVHRDIKPDNILLQRVSGHPLLVRIVDFGLARIVAGTTNTQAIFGTPGYMAPELANSRDVRLAADTYSLAAVLFEMLVLKPLMKGNTIRNFTPENIRRAFSQVNLKGVVALSQPLQSFFDKALKKLPADRYQSAEEFRLALHTALGGETVSLVALPVLPNADDRVQVGPLQGEWENISMQDTLTNPEFKALGEAGKGGWGWFATGLAALLLTVGLATWSLTGPPISPVVLEDTRSGSQSSPDATDIVSTDVGLPPASGDAGGAPDHLSDVPSHPDLPDVRQTPDTVAAERPDVATPQNGPTDVVKEVANPQSRQPDAVATVPRVEDLQPALVPADKVPGGGQSADVSVEPRTPKRRVETRSPLAGSSLDVTEAPPPLAPQPAVVEVMVDAVQANVKVTEGARTLGRTPLSITVLAGRPRRVVLKKRGYKDRKLTLTEAHTEHRIELQTDMW